MINVRPDDFRQDHCGADTVNRQPLDGVVYCTEPKGK